MKMNPRTLSVLLLLAGPLGADPDWHVEYPDSFCVVEGSTATIPCSFTHPAVHKKTGVVVERVERVVWCPDHPICHLTIPNVYDSSTVRADSRFLYLGDLVGNCTLKIIKTEKRDAATYRFHFVTNGGGWTGQKGVRVTVVKNVRLTVSSTNGEDVKVRSSVTDHVVKEGGQVTLTCTSACSFHQLDVHWYRNSHALPETGPALHLSGLTNDDTGNYTCSLDSSGQKTSAPWCLLVGEYEDGEVVKVRSSVTDNVVKEGGQVTLTCTSACSFHQLDVHWYRNGHALSETGPTLHLSSLTNNNTGNYTCSLDSSGQKTSAPWSLLVGEYEDGEDVKVRSSVTDHVVKEGGQVTLTCTSACSFHQLGVLWYRNGHALSETGPALHLSSLTNDDAGNYTCSLDSSGQKTSAPWCLLVGEYEDGEVVKVRSSVTDHVVKEGGQVTLTCTSACSFHQLDVLWYRNGHALSETGPALHLSNLTNNNTGNYTCSLDSSGQKTSVPWSLVVLEDEGRHNVTATGKVKSFWLLTVSVVSVVLAGFLLLLAGLVFAKRQAQKKASDVIQKLEVDCKQEAVGASEEVSYATVHFKRNSSRSAPGPEHEIVYSEVVG
ncbi:sialoadhesin-like isoform X2 [Gadus morhua]|uniref:sialoadhesin-like isoform X2 n=1 Tax=Gadus morhua TaxID=8049 RepID=UPI0011B6A85F|nr:sialoadhesin-like isoform X2 [Gadus morhua]